jgi:hypothetical protein
MSEGIKKGSAKKSKFSIMLEEKCPEGQKYWPVKKQCVPVGDGEKKRMRKGDE